MIYIEILVFSFFVSVGLIYLRLRS